MAVPLLTTDYFTKPEPTGSISGTTARIMAQAGSILGERMEKAQVSLEAKALAPAIEKGYGDAYHKIAAGDMSGFEDIAKVKGLAATNPLLAQMSKDGDALGIHLANNVTQQQVLSDRLKSSQALQTERLTQQGRMQTERITGSQDLQSARYNRMDAEKIQAENEKRQLNNQKAIDAANEESKVTGQKVEPVGIMPLLPMPSTGSGPTADESGNDLPSNDVSGGVVQAPVPPIAPVANPPARVVQQNAGPAVTNPMAAGQPPVAGEPALPAGPTPAAPAPSPTPTPAAARTKEESLTAFMNDPDAADIMQRNGVMMSDFNTANGDKDHISLTRSADGKTVHLSNADSTKLIQRYIAAFGADEPSSVGTTVPVSTGTIQAAPKPIANQKDEVEFGNVKFHIGQPNKADQLQLKEETIKGLTTEKVFANPNFKEDADSPVKARTQFIEALGVMKANPNAASFVSDFLSDKDGKGVTFKNIQKTDNGKTVLSAQMYGVKSDGTEVPFNPKPVLDKNGKPTGQTVPDTIDGSFVEAYHKAIEVKDIVTNKYGISPTREAKAPKVNPWDSIKDEDVKKAAAEAYADVQRPEGDPKRITLEEAKSRVIQASAKKEEVKLADNKYDLGAIDKQVAAEKASANKPAIEAKKADLKKQIASLEKEIDSGREFGVSVGMFSPSTYSAPMSATKKRQLVIMRSNLIKQLESL